MSTAVAQSPEAYLHEAFLYAGDAELVDGVSRFARGGVEAGEPVLLVLGARKLDMVRQALGDDGRAVQFADMADVGANPGRIIAAWKRFVETGVAAGTGMRGVGEPIWAERTGDVLAECHRHEALLNVAFDSAPAWWLMCPYDTTTLDPAVIEEARRNHPFVRSGDLSVASESYVDPATSAALAPLPPAPRDALRLAFEAATLPVVRAAVSRFAARAGFGSAQIADLAVAANEVAENSVHHGGGRGTLRVWLDGDTLRCDVRDAGRIADPLAGRFVSVNDVEGSRGLWLANALCDLVQLRTSVAGTTVRLHLQRRLARG
jgi:anti-sigma regulatory factor (Ser/Thr protein kinase)